MKMIQRHIDTLEQGLLIEALELVRTIQGAPKVRGQYKPTLPISTINHLGQKLQDHVAGMFASDDDVDTAELADQNQNFPAQRQP